MDFVYPIAIFSVISGYDFILANQFCINHHVNVMHHHFNGFSYIMVFSVSDFCSLRSFLIGSSTLFSVFVAGQLHM